MAASIARILGVRSVLTCGRLGLHPASTTSLHHLIASTSPPPPPSSLVINYSRPLHTSTVTQVNNGEPPKHFLSYNKKVYPPTPHGENNRPAFICHQKSNIKYSPKKMWYVASLVRGMKIDEAIAQLKFVHKKGAMAAREALEEARDLAVKQHCVEFPSNLWVSESFVGKGIYFRGYRRHARRRFGKVDYKHCHYFVTLEEGEPPEHYYYHRRPLKPEEMLQEWMDELRERKVPY